MTRSASIEKKEQARILLAQGYRYTHIAKTVGMSRTSVIKWLSPKSIQSTARYKEKMKASAPLVRGSGSQTLPNPDEVALRLAEIPKDTRSPGEVAMGDPLPGRSYLDMMRKNQQ